MTHRKGDQGGDEHETKQAVLGTLARILQVVLIKGGRAGAAVRVAALHLALGTFATHALHWLLLLL